MSFNPWFAVNLSCLLPGLGLVVGGHWRRGILWLGTVVLLLGVGLVGLVGPRGDMRLGSACLAIAGLLWVSSLFDTYDTLRGRGTWVSLRLGDTAAQHSRQTPRQPSRQTPRQALETTQPLGLWFGVLLGQLLPGLGHFYLGDFGAASPFVLEGTVLALLTILSLGGLSLGEMAIASWLLPIAALLPAIALYRLTHTVAQPVSPTLRSRLHRQGLSLAIGLFFCRLVLLGIPVAVQHWVAPFDVPSESMLPTLQVGDRILVYQGPWARIQRGDIVVFENPTEPNHFFVKRLMAMGGDQIAIRAGQLLRNGQSLHEPYLQEAIAYSLPATSLPPGQCFVLGDNRNSSYDSHLWGSLPCSKILGKAYRINWPLERNQPL